MTFSTPWGNYRYKRLAFGGKNSQDRFDAEIAKIISGIPHVLNNRDDIMVGGKDLEEHNRNLETLLERLTIHNIMLRKENWSRRRIIPKDSPWVTETERKYAQIEREALAVEFSTNRMYLAGSQQFQIATDHKPLLPIFNNPNAKLPPRLERLRMKTQHLDFVMIHIPGKSNMTDYLSRHPLPDIEETHLEHHVRAVIATEHAVVLDKIREETSNDNELQALIQVIRTGNWQNTAMDLKQYYDMRTEIYEADGVVLRGERIIPPIALRKKIISVAHKQGHLGSSKTKEMIRNKYLFPSMNIQIENIVQA